MIVHWPLQVPLGFNIELYHISYFLPNKWMLFYCKIGVRPTRGKFMRYAGVSGGLFFVFY